VASEKSVSDPGPTFEKGGRPHRPLEEAGGRPHDPLREAGGRPHNPLSEAGGVPDTGYYDNFIERRLDLLDRRTTLLEEAWRLKISLPVEAESELTWAEILSAVRKKLGF
jgi:hypothetical protein